MGCRYPAEYVLDSGVVLVAVWSAVCLVGYMQLQDAKRRKGGIAPPLFGTLAGFGFCFVEIFINFIVKLTF